MFKSFAPILPLLVICIGCAHHQLGYQTVNQAHTVADVHTQQVLDNLAKFAHNRNALPHFSYPSQGSSEVNGNVGGTIGFNFLPSALSNWSIGAGADRGMRENYTMTPVNDPRKLELMRCAYQRAVSACCSGAESAHCPDCQKRFNQFYLGTPDPQDAAETYQGWQVYYYEKPKGDQEKDTSKNDSAKTDEERYSKLFAVVSSPVNPLDPNSGTVTYYDLKTGELLTNPNIVKLVMQPQDLPAFTKKTGNITSECLYSPCWFYVGCKKEVPKCCAYVGKYCDTYVWVPESGVDELTKLTIAILNYAIYEDAKPESPETKSVEYYLDENGMPTSKNNARYNVSASIAADEDVRTLTTTPHSEFAVRLGTAERLNAEIETINAKIEEIKDGKNAYSQSNIESMDQTITALEKRRDAILNMPSPIRTNDNWLPTQQPTRLPMPSLLEIDQQLRNISPAPAR